MSSLRDDPDRPGPDRPKLDAYLDGVLAEPERAHIGDQIRASRALQADVELQEQIDASLRRAWAPPAMPENLTVALRESASVSPAAVAFRRRVWLLAVTASTAAAIWGVLAWQYSTTPPRPQYNPNLPLASIYAAQVAAGFQPKWVCDNDREFASTFLTRQGQGLLLSTMPTGSKMVGLTYCGGISRYTTTMLARVGDTPVMVFVDRAASDSHPSLPPADSGLHLFRKELRPLVLYELTPLAEPRVMDYLHLGDVPTGQ